MSNKVARNELIEMYDYRCFLLGKISKKNILTYHHINPKKPATIENGSLLARLEHDMFHVVDNSNRKKGKEVNDGFQDYKRSREIAILYQLREFVINEVYNLGYTVEDNGEMYVLKR